MVKIFNKRVTVLVNSDKNRNAQFKFKEIAQWTRSAEPDEIAKLLKDVKG